MPEEEMMTADPPQRSVDTVSVRNMFTNDPSATPTQVVLAYGERYGRILDKAFVQVIKRRISYDNQ